MNRGFRISISSCLAVLIFITQFVSFPYISWYNLLRYATIVAVGVYIWPRIQVVLLKKYIFVNMFAVVFSLLVVLTAYLNRSRMVKRDPFLAAIVFTAAFLLFLVFMEIMAEQRMAKKIVGLFFVTAFMVAIINDILMFAIPSLYSEMNNRYLVGTKFNVVYIHILTIFLYLGQANLREIINGKKNDIKIIILMLLGVWSVFVGIWVDCLTGVAGVFILFALIMVINGREKLAFNGIVYCITQLFCFLFVFFYEFVLSNQIVKNIIVDIFNRDITLTSRTSIYAKVPAILTLYNGWGIGMGYGSSYELGTKYGGFPDTQNGILEWIWQVGAPTTIVMVFMFGLILNISKRYINRYNQKILLPLISGFYLFTILGIVEITIAIMYFSLSVLIMGMAAGTYEDKSIYRKVRP